MPDIGVYWQSESAAEVPKILKSGNPDLG